MMNAHDPDRDAKKRHKDADELARKCLREGFQPEVFHEYLDDVDPDQPALLSENVERAVSAMIRRQLKENDTGEDDPGVTTIS